MPEDVEKIVIGHKREGTRGVLLAARHRWLVPAIGPVAEVGTMPLRKVVHVQLVKVPRSATWRRMSPFLLRYSLLAWTRENATSPVVGVRGSSERVRGSVLFGGL